MSFITNLFKRKPGGTFVGNLIRGVAGQASGGILGGGGMMISQEEADKRDLSDAQFEQKYGMTKTGVRLTQTLASTGSVIEAGAQTTMDKIKANLKSKTAKIIGAVIAGALIIWGAMKLLKKGRKRSY